MLRLRPVVAECIPGFKCGRWASLVIAFGLLWCLSLPPQIFAGTERSDEPHVTQFSPQGLIKEVRQVTARFSEPMVPFGDPRSPDNPFEIDCPSPGRPRWIDSRTWVYDFDADLPGGIRCRFQLRQGLVTLAGRALGRQETFTFSTGGPAIRRSNPSRDTTIDEDQAFVLDLDASPTEASVLAHVSFAVAGMPERIGIRVIGGDGREAILNTLYGWSRRQHVIVLQARQRFPSGAQVRLIWGKGVTVASGVAAEQDQILSFKVREAFTAQFRCERENSQADCLPIRPMTVRFSGAVAWELARQAVLVGPSERRWQPEIDGDEVPRFVTNISFKSPFPEAATFRVELPDSLTDDAGRPLANASNFPLQVKTADFPPLAKFSARFGIIEWKAEPTLPVTLRNLEPEVQGTRLQVGTKDPDIDETAGVPPDRVTGKRGRVAPDHIAEVLTWLRRVAVARRDASLFDSVGSEVALQAFQLPKPHGATPLEVIGLPLDAPGLYIVELASPRLGMALLQQPQPMYVPTAALVTNLAVHFKWGREGSLIWVTTLDEGLPAAGAQVAVHNCHGALLWNGTTDGQGIAHLDGLPDEDALPRCAYDGTLYHHDFRQTTAINRLDRGLFVTAKVGDDFSFVHSSWDRGIEPWRFQLPTASDRDAIVVHTILDRSLLRAGDTVHMKHILRTQDLRGFSLVPDDKRPNLLSIRHLGSEEKYEFPVPWDASGVAENTWAIPQGAKLGTYQIVLGRKSVHQGQNGGEFESEWVSGEFRVEEFRVPLMRGIIRPPATPLIGVTELPVDLAVQYLSGGGASNLPVILRAQLRPKHVTVPADFEGVVFANGQVREGIVRSGGSPSDDDEAAAVTPAKGAVHQRLELTLDAAGTTRVTITHLPQAAVPLDLLLELEYWDPNGEVQTVATTVPLWPTTQLVGLKQETWAGSRERLTVQMTTIDVTGRPVAGTAVRLEVFERKFYSHRKRLVGGFYAYEHVEDTRFIAEFCRGTTDGDGLLVCEGKPPTSGNLILQASLVDEVGRLSSAHQSVWVSGTPQWFDVQDSDRIDVLAEKRRYEPGETARLQVRMPFREATALVTVEREGVREASVVHLSSNEPVVEVAVREDYAPNMFISVLAVRGRVAGVQPTALVDLGRPSFKLGVAEIRVDWRRYELTVNVEADRQIYRVRDTVLVHIAVRTADGQPPPAPSEVAVAAVDEGLLELLPNTSWNLLEAMMGRRSYRVQTATAQLEVVGKRHYGLKALPQGGGGGQQLTRELFDTLLLWKGRVPLDPNGEALVEVPLNDSLTSFRIVAVATGGLQRFGTGSVSIRTTQDLMMLSGVAPLVREGDQFWSEFTLRNTTDRPMDVAVTARVEGLTTALTPQRVSLASGEAQVIGWEITAPLGMQRLHYEVEAHDQGGAFDRLRVPQQVVPTVPLRTLQATLSQWQQEMAQAVARPSDALPYQGGVEVLLRATIADGLEATRRWMQRYPYTCLEQQVSRAVALRDEGLWRDVVGTLPAHLDADGLLKYFPSMPYGSDVLTSYVLSVIHAAGWAFPSELQEAMRRGLHKFVEGGILRRSPVPAVDLPLRKLAALEALSRYENLQPQLVGSLTIEPNLWPTSAALDWWSVLHRVPAMPNRAARLSDVEHIVRSRLNLQGTTLAFSTEEADKLWWLMTSTDTNSVRLILLLLEAGQWQGELPQLLRGALARQRRGAWDLTVANAWGALAVEQFSQTFEKTPVGGTTSVSLPTLAQHVDWAKTPKGVGLLFPWPPAAETLSVEHVGVGHPWVTIQAQAAIPLKAPLSSGYRLDKALIPVDTSTAGGFKRGDVVRVRLTIEAERDMSWVVVNDPIPAGATHLGRGFGRDSQLAVQGEARQGWAIPAFEERSFEAYRAYYEYLPRGRYSLEYTIRLNQRGRFHLPPTRVEALYAPEMFGELPNATIEVQR